MRKYTKFAVWVMVITGMILLTGCSKKKLMTLEDFISHMEENGYTVADVSEQYDEDEFESVTIAYDSDESYQFEFYVMTSDNGAKSVYNQLLNMFDLEHSGTGSEVTVNLPDYSSYTRTVDGMHMHAERNESTVLYVEADSSKAEEIKAVVKEMEE